MNGITVSSTHRVLYKDKWIYIDKHPDSIPILLYNEPYLYCLNTASKKIEINGITFADWDELFADEISELTRKIHVISSPSPSKSASASASASASKEANIHKYLDGGFIDSTMLTLDDNSQREIKDIRIGDTLKDGVQVYGIVEIEGEGLSNQYHYNLGFCGGPNINICDTSINLTSSLGMNHKENKRIKHVKLYHLLTDRQYFYINAEKNEKQIKVYHYNSNVELFLDKYSKKLLSMKYV